ncbi:hypothetical protein NHF48_000160 [Sphingomonas sp. H160509]|uniref:hypothetical protein n=1 Tax=Sphingomonas sp. H160509 TaxID=2955313 RepID=UPI0020979CE8|nr:hypothetical protein [Sphingomonas sp. H160509]MDD1449683.1 hypothetical protein [Sphingomonas sp. H160509]
MTEATWGESAKTPDINWRMSASLENVPRGDTDIAEVTNLERAVRDWVRLDTEHRDTATLTTDHPVQIVGVSSTTFTGEAISVIAEHLPPIPSKKE